TQLALTQPYWERSQQHESIENQANPSGAPDAGAALARVMMPTMENILDRHAQQQSLARMLACHAAIRKFRWENDRLPTSLVELKLGALAIDPFSGQPLGYKTLTLTTYRLEAIGPLARDENGKTIAGQHEPVTFTPAPK